MAAFHICCAVCFLRGSPVYNLQRWMFQGVTQRVERSEQSSRE
jgi:hypothetical protein